MKNKTGRILLLVSCAAFLIMQRAASAATLQNRWSFSEPISSSSLTDSVSGVVGTLTNGNANNFVSSGTVWLDGANGAFVSLPGGLLTNLQAVSFEGWVYSLSSIDNVCLFEFSSELGTGVADSYIRYVVHDAGNTRNQLELANFTNGVAVQQLTAPAGFGDMTLHVVCVYDPVANYMAIYTNGVLEAIRQNLATNALQFVGTNGGSLGQSPWTTADPYLAGTIDEFRIWNGALNPLEIASSENSGPDSTNITPGNVTSLQVKVPFFQQTEGTVQQLSVIATVDNFPTPLDITMLTNIVYTNSGGTNVLTVNSKGQVTANAAGSATVSASFSGKTNTQTITVVPVVAVLSNRWSFNEPLGSPNATDSVSHVVGTLLGATTNDCYVSNGVLWLSGVAANSPNMLYSGGLMSSFQSVTLEGWLTNSATPDNVCLFEFGNGISGNNYLRFVLHDTSNTRNVFEIVASGTIGLASPTIPPCGLANQYVHVLCMYDPGHNVMAVFTNGVRCSVTHDGALPTKLLSLLGTNEFRLGKSPWTGDPWLAGGIDEFRIYNGTMTPQKVALSYLAGPNAIGFTNDPGALQSIAVSAPATIARTSPPQTFDVLANYANLSNWRIIANTLTNPVPGLTLTSSDTNVIVVNANGTLTPAQSNWGSAVITAAYQGKTNSAVVTVVAPPNYSLVHRWSFNETGGTTATDSVAGANATLMGAAAFDGLGNVFLDGDTNSASYVSLPGRLVSSLQAVTFEAWCTNSATNISTTLFGFGSSNSGTAYIRFMPRSGSAQSRFEIATANTPSGGVPLSGGTSTLNYGVRLTNAVHVVCVYDPTIGMQAIYTNGVQVAVRNGVTMPLSGVGQDVGYMGRSVFTTDALNLNSAINEFRIYSGRLLPGDIAASHLIGPTQMLLTTSPTLSASLTGGTLSLDWPIAAGDFLLQSSPVLGPAVWTVVTNTPAVNGSNYEVQVSASSSAQYYRLRR